MFALARAPRLLSPLAGPQQLRHGGSIRILLLDTVVNRGGPGDVVEVGGCDNLSGLACCAPFGQVAADFIRHL